MRTTNGGSSWESTTFSSDNEFTLVHFVNQNVGYVLGENWHESQNPILKTTDGGNNWEEQDSDTGLDFNSIDTFDEDHAFTVGNYGLILTTENGGDEWTKITQGAPISFYSVFFTDTETGYICGEDGVLMKSTDGGITSDFLIPAHHKILQMYFLSMKIPVISVAASHVLSKTTNAGDSWTSINNGLSGALYSVVFPENETVGYTCGNLGIFKTN